MVTPNAGLAVTGLDAAGALGTDSVPRRGGRHTARQTIATVDASCGPIRSACRRHEPRAGCTRTVAL
jgi:hypothetical protein